MLKALRRGAQQLEGLVAKVLEESAHLETEVGVRVVRRECDLWPLVEALIHDLHPVAGTSSTQLVNEIPEDLMIYADAGLGLAIVRTFAEAHGGQVAVETRAGGGSTFRFSLPTRAAVRERAAD